MLFLPELNLLWQAFRLSGFCWFAMDHITPLPLSPCNKKNSHATLFRKPGFHALEMGFLTRETNAGTSVNAPLQHLESIIFKPLAEIVCGLSLGLASNRQVECNNQPAHLEFFSVHGL